MLIPWIYKNYFKIMKQILLTFITLLFFGDVYSQDTLQDSVYKKVNQIREQSNLNNLQKALPFVTSFLK